MFFLWRVSEKSLLQFVAHLNSVHATIKFKVKPGESFNFSTRSINFLLVTSSYPSHISANNPYRLNRIEFVPARTDLWMQPLISSD